MNLNELVADIHAFRDYLKAERGLAEPFEQRQRAADRSRSRFAPPQQSA